MIRRWGLILRDMVSGYIRHDGPFLAAGIAFYALFSVLPVALVAVSVLGYLLPAGTQAEKYTLEMAHYYLPPNVVVYLEDSVRQLGEDRGKLGAFGLLALLWSGRHMFRAMEYGLHRAWELPRDRNFITGNLVSLLLFVLTVFVTFAIAVLSAFLTWLETMMAHWNMPHLAGVSLDQAVVWSWLHTWVVTPLATLLVFLLLYVILPSRQVPLTYALPGAGFATVAFKLCSWVYLTFIVSLLQVNPIYGSIWSLAGLMIWLYLGGSVFLLGAELVHALRSREAPPPKARARKPRRRSPPSPRPPAS